MTLPSRDDALAWIGLPVHDSTGAVCGSCRNVFADQDSGLPEWVEVQLGSGDPVFVPTLGARLDDGVVHLGHALDVVERSPRFTPDVDRTPEEEKALYEHYGVEWSDARSDTLLPAAVDGEQAASPQRLRRVEPTVTEQIPVAPPVPAASSAWAPAPAASQGGGLPRAALVAGPVAAAAVAGAGLLRRRRQQAQQTEQAGLGVAVLAAALALLAVVVAWRRRRVSGPDVLDVGEIPQMPAVVDHRTPQQVDAPY